MTVENPGETAMITKTTEQAIRALIYLARLRTPAEKPARSPARRRSSTPLVDSPQMADLAEPDPVRQLVRTAVGSEVDVMVVHRRP